MGRKRRHMNQITNSMTEEDKKNPLFSKYYQEQEGVIPKEEFEQFIECMATDLPAVFRVTGFREQSRELARLIQEHLIQKLIEKSQNNEMKLEDYQAPPAPQQLTWYPGGLTWQLDASRIMIRKSTELKKLHQFLVSESESGFISRQEAVSMIPPLLLGVESHHKILDMCAAPGSKTAQLLELLHSAVPPGANSLDHPTGLVVANDVDSKRCYLMIHQVLRMQSPAVVITRQDATIFPRLYLPDEEKTGSEKQLLFDRILADVPCSGDGTLRKNPDLWKRWTPNQGINEHFLQTKILRRGLELLKVGGRLVYSTCSLNPVEDEAVIAHMLSQCEGQVVLTDVRSLIPKLKSQPGLTNWRLMFRNGSWAESMEQVPDTQTRNVRPSMFPPAGIDNFHMEHCLRILPHHQNTGGFFVAVLDKIGELPWMKAAKRATATNGAAVDDAVKMETSQEPGEVNEKLTSTKEELESELHSSDLDETPIKVEPVKEEKPAVNPSQNFHKKASRVYKEDPFYFMSPDDKDFAAIREFYQLPAEFPPTQLMFRSTEGKRRNFYFTNKIVRDLVKINSSKGLNLINLGVRLFGVSEDKHFNGYRLMQYGVDLAKEIVGDKRRVKLTCVDDLLTLLKYDVPLSTQFSPDIMKQFHQLSVGPVLMEYQPPADLPDGELPRVPIVFTGWRGFASLRHYVCKHGRDHLLHLCGVEPEPVKDAMVHREGRGGDQSPVMKVQEDSCPSPSNGNVADENCEKRVKIEEEVKDTIE